MLKYLGMIALVSAFMVAPLLVLPVLAQDNDAQPVADDDAVAVQEEVRRQAKEVEGLELMDQAYQAMIRNEFDAALKLFAQALDAMPSRPHTMEVRQKARQSQAECEYRIALDYCRLSQWSNAKDAARRALGYFPGHTRAMRLLERIQVDEQAALERDALPVPARYETEHLDRQQRINQTGVARADLATELFGKAQRALAIITTSGCTASGFVLETGGKKHLVTSEHVLRGGKPTAKLLTGHQLHWSKVEIANDLDLARLELDDADVDALSLTTNQPSMGGCVFVFGNSEGGMVATSLAGKILGVGPDRIEIDAAFVQGNSGSPILGEDGTVFGVATYATRSPDPNDWVKKGTRFTDVRRFGLRMENVKWIALSWEDYSIRAETLADLATFCNDVYDLCFTDKYTNPRYKNIEYVYDYSKNSGRYVRMKGLCKMLSEVAAAFTKFKWKDIEVWYYTKESSSKARSSHSKARSSPQQSDAKRNLYMSEGLAERHFNEFRKTFDQLYDKPAPMILQSDWKTTRFRNEAMFWHDVLKHIIRKDER